MHEMRYWQRLCEAGYQYDLFAPDSLYHTTSPAGAWAILADKEIRPAYEGFVSLSERPNLYDIRAHGAVIVFNLRHLYAQLEPVEYTVAWAHAHAQQARYIAGEGWSEQFEYTSDEDEDDEDGYDRAYADAEMEAFLTKAEEDEWISLHPGVPVRFAPAAVTGVMLAHLDAEAGQELHQMGYPHVTLRPIISQ